MLMSGQVNEDNQVLVGPITTKTHAVHVLMNPVLGNSFQIITPDDGEVYLGSPTKAKAALMPELDWHYKVFIVRIDLPNLRD